MSYNYQYSSMKIFLKTLVMIGFAFVAGCKARPQATINGDYVSSEDGPTNVTNTLNVTSDTIVASSIAGSGSLAMTYSYKVTGVSSNTVTVELTQPNQPQRKIDIQIQNDCLVLSDALFVGGKSWKRK
jgi:hypothetical protein